MRVTPEQLIEILDKSDAKEITIGHYSDVEMYKDITSFNKMLAAGKITREEIPSETVNPFYTKEGRKYVPTAEVKAYTIGVFGFGDEYAERVNKAIRMNGDQVEKKEWKVPVVPNKVYKHNVTGTLYIQVYEDPLSIDDGHERQMSLLVDGRDATPEEAEIINQWRYRSSGGSFKKQLDAGVGEGYEVNVKTFKFVNIEFVDIDNQVYELSM